MAYVEAIIGDDSSVLKDYYTHINVDDMMHIICGLQTDFLGSSEDCWFAKGTKHC